MNAHPTTITDGAEWITLRQAATYLTVSWFTVRRMIADGRITSDQWRRVGRQIRIRKSSLDAVQEEIAA
jgi:excisionase family DNA binding protein